MFGQNIGPNDEVMTPNIKEYPDSAQRPAPILGGALAGLIEQAVQQISCWMEGRQSALERGLSQSIAKQQACCDRVLTRLEALEAQLAKLEAGQRQVLYELGVLQDQQRRLEEESKLLENASNENRLLAEQHYQQHIIEPMARSLFAVFDFVEDVRKVASVGGREDDAHIDALIEGILVQLRQFLSVYEIEPLRHSPTAKFDPSVMRPVKIIHTDNKPLDNRIGESLRSGFRWRQRVLLRPESVTLYKYKETQMINPNKENERG